MSPRQDIYKAIRHHAFSGNVAAFPKPKPKPRRKKKRKMPPQGKRYSVVQLERTGVMPWRFRDDVGGSYTRITVNDKQYMRRDDGVFFKQMRDGRWTSMLTPPKGGVAAYRRLQIAKGVAAGAAATGAAAGVERLTRDRR